MKIEKNAGPQVTQEILEGWKTTHGNIYEVTVEGFTGYFRELTRIDLTADKRKKILCTRNPFQTSLNTLKVCWLGGNDELLCGGDLTNAAYYQMEAVFFQNVKKYFPQLFN